MKEMFHLGHPSEPAPDEVAREVVRALRARSAAGAAMLRADDEESLRRGVCAAFELAGYRAAHLRGSHGAADVRGASASFVVLPLTGEGEPSLLVESEGDFHAEELAVLSDLADDLHAWFVRRDRQSAFMAEHAAQEEQLRAARKTDDAARRSA